MRFRPDVPAAYAPAQAATAVDAEGRPVALLFVPQWNQVVEEVAAGAGDGRVVAAETQWAFSREIGLLILFVRFEAGRELAVTFAPSGGREFLDWWERHRRVDLVLAAGALQDVELEALGLASPGTRGEEGNRPAAYVRVRDVPFFTA